MKTKLDTSIWDNQPSKVAIVVPTRDTVHSPFAYCLTQLIKTSESAGVETFLFFNSGSVLLNQREHLVNSSFEVESDYTLWLDSDMTFPSTTLLKLLSHSKNIVGCNYKKRSNPQTPVAYKNIGDLDSWVPLDEKEDLVEVEGVGMGCILIKTELFNKLRKPYFEFTYDRESDDWLGEDFNLFTKMRNIGENIYIDTNLSREIGHLGTSKFGF